VTYRLRVELAQTDPLIWRRVELASDLTLDRVHDILQPVMGWTNSHLHQFASGEGMYDPNAELYQMPSSIDEGMVGVDERAVRLDEVLGEVGDRLWYEYDFGDGWMHAIDLEEVLPTGPASPSGRCLAGARACPPEDCGGVGGYVHLLEVLAGPPGGERDDLIGWLGGEFDPTSFELDAVNQALIAMDNRAKLDIDPRSALGELLALLPGDEPPVVTTALNALTRPAPEPSPEDRARAVRSYALLLDRVGPDGVALTQAGYLPPVHVKELATELDLDETWFGKNNRESLTFPVLSFRESAQQLGLLRKVHNRLSLTKTGRRARNDPELLWRHISGVLPLSLTSRGPEAEAAREAGALLLLAAAAGFPRDKRKELVLAGLQARGWRNGSGGPLTGSDLIHLTRPTSIVLEHTNVLPWPLGRPVDTDSPVSATGIAFARAALGV
jgi:hypothetical protein